MHTLIKRMQGWLVNYIVAILGSMQEWLVVHIASHHAGVAHTLIKRMQGWLVNYIVAIQGSRMARQLHCSYTG